MHNADLELSRSMDRDKQLQLDAENAKLSEGVQERLRTSGLDVTGPSSDAYDYVGADRAGTPFVPAEGGGVNLPNKFHQNQYVAGRRVSDGIKVHERNDPNGFGAEGFKRMQAGHVNTETGAPPEAMDAVMPLMAEHVQNGGTVEDFESPYGGAMATDAYQTLGATATIQAIAHELRALPAGEEAAPLDDEAPALTLEDIAGDPNFVTAGRVIRDHFGLGEDEEDEPDDAAIAEDMIEEMAATFSSAWKMGAIIYGIESGDMSPETQAAYAYAFEVYDKFTPWSMDVLQGTLTGVVQDLPMYIGTGGAGAVAAKAASKTAMVRHVMSLLAKHKGKTAVAAASAAGGAEGFVFGAGEEATRQKVSGQENFDRVWKQGTNTAIAGALLTAPFGVLASKPGRDFVKKGYHMIADEIGRSKSPMNSQGGWIGVSESETYNGIPTAIDDMGVPMADASGTSYYSNLYRTAVEDGLIGNKETDPMKYLAVLQRRQLAGKFKGYEMQEAQLAEFLEKKAFLDETVNKDMVDDYLWANRPRVNSLLSTVDDFMGMGSEMTLSHKNPDNLRRSAAVTVVKDNFFKTEEVMNDQGQKAWKITNKITKQTEITQSPGTYLADSTRGMISNMSDDQVIQLIREYDKNVLLGPPRWGKDIGGKGSPTIVKGDNANNYQELRLFLPYGGMDNVDDIAVDRFGATYNNLTERQQKRVNRIKGFATEKRPDSYRDTSHYPLEHNRLVHVRTQDLFQPQYGRTGQRVLAVNELQSDLHQALKKSGKETEDGAYIIEDSAGNEIKQPDKQATDGWINMTVNRTMQMAQQGGYTKVAFPVDPDMIKSIQLWGDDDVVPGVVNFYDKLAKMIRKDKKLAKTWGITSIKLDDVAAEPGGNFLGQKMMVITFDPAKGAKTKPIYGIGATAGAGGTLSIDAKKEDE